MEVLLLVAYLSIKVYPPMSLLRLLRSKAPLATAFLAAFASVSNLRADTPVNQLTRSETLSGWQLLFDGKSADGWRNYKSDKISEGWKVEDGALVRFGKNAGDIITEKEYQYFELMLEYKISKAGNSGLMFHVNEKNGAPWQSGPEIQIQDNVDGRDPQKAGWLYQLYQPVRNQPNTDKPIDFTRPVGEWNQIYVRIAKNQCEVSMNGSVYYTFNVGSQDWHERIAKSKFANMPDFGKLGKGHICLQDHNDLVSFRNIKIRELNEDGTVPQPIDGKISVKQVPAFPDMKWEGWQPVEEDGTVNRPLRILELTYAKGDPNRLYVIDQLGRIYTFENNPKVKQAKLILDIRSKVNPWYGSGANEQGLLGLALHPKFHENKELFISYTSAEDNRSVVSRFKLKNDGSLQVDPESEEILLEVPQPFKNHNGGPIEFGPDGFLYIGFGDGGFRDDPHANSQNRSQLLGSILRIDVDTKANGLKYGIPADNPFVGQDGIRGEIFAYGFRNPWRIAFDKATGKLWVGDVGQDLYEEVDIVEKGGNYGWSNWEGTHPFGNRPVVEGTSKPIPPVWEYDHQIGKSITGGRVSNTERLPALKGKYIYADYVSGTVWALSHSGSGQETQNHLLLEKGVPVFAFGEDAAGEIYFTTDTAREQNIFKFEMTE